MTAPPPRIARRRAVRLLLLSVGWTSFALGMIALAIPLVPTTPFLLLSAACFARSSERFYVWLMNHRWFGPPLRNFREKGGLTRRQKWLSGGALWPAVLVSAIFIRGHVWERASLVAAAGLATLYVVFLPTVTDEKS